MTDPFTHLSKLGRGRHLHFGCGPHILAGPWENFDRDVDIRKPLAFPDLCAAHIMAEHVIEHVDFRSGMRFLRECRRLLEPGGVLRLAFPDVTRFDCDDPENMSGSTRLYLDFLQGLNEPSEQVQDIYRFILDGSGHQSCWTFEVGFACLLASGFRRVDSCEYAHSEHPMLNGIDGHHLTSSLTAATLETTILEATK